MTKNIVIDSNRITDWNSFHDVFMEVFGFPSYYGRNMDAWIDCMTYLDDPDSRMTTVHVSPGDVIVLCLPPLGDFKKNHKELYDALIECASFVNYRRIETNEQAILALSFCK